MQVSFCTNQIAFVVEGEHIACKAIHETGGEVLVKACEVYTNALATRIELCII